MLNGPIRPKQQPWRFPIPKLPNLLNKSTTLKMRSNLGLTYSKCFICTNAKSIKFCFWANYKYEVLWNNKTFQGVETICKEMDLHIYRTFVNLTLQGPREHNVSSSNFQWQIQGRVKQISMFCKLESCRVTSLHICCIFLFSKFECEKYLNFFLGNVV